MDLATSPAKISLSHMHIEIISINGVVSIAICISRSNHEETVFGMCSLCEFYAS